MKPTSALRLSAASLFLLAARPVDHSVPEYLGEEATEALALVRTDTVFEQFSPDLPPHLLTPIVLPEVARYNGFSNFFETAALQAFYVEDGSASVDFSIGPFQMKPSFAERIEKRVAQDSSLQKSYPNLALCAGMDSPSARRERLQRLSTTAGQAPYLEAFVRVVLHDFPVVHTMCDSDQTAFVASAYNGGFERDFETIENGVWMRCYPHGTRHQGQQLRYTETALWFAHQLGLLPEQT